MESYNIKFKAKYRDAIYDAKGIVYDIDESMSIRINECIWITYYKDSGEIYLANISKYGMILGPNNTPIWGEFKSYEWGLDALVMITLAFIKRFIGKKTLSISDLYMEDNISGSWQRFFNTKGVDAVSVNTKGVDAVSVNTKGAKTTYGKFGFQLTSPGEENKFDEIMSNIEKNINHQILDKKITYKEYIKSLMQKQNDPKIIQEYFKIDEKMNVMRIWYMDWNFYKSILEKAKIYNIEMD
jgi:hypothetical protein